MKMMTGLMIDLKNGTFLSLPPSLSPSPFCGWYKKVIIRNGEIEERVSEREKERYSGESESISIISEEFRTDSISLINYLINY